MNMGRPRKDGQKDLPPGFYHYQHRNPYIKMRGMKTPVDLGAITRAEALEIYWAFRREWDSEQTTRQADALAARLEAAARGADRISVASYAGNWRKQHLPTLVKRNGQPLSPKTRSDYDNMIFSQVERYPLFKDLPITAVRTKHLRKFLSQWIGSPNFYNYMKWVCVRFLQFAVDEDLLDANPAYEVNSRPITKRDVYMPDDHYIAITRNLEERFVRACDLLYLVTHNPKDVLRLREDKIERCLVNDEDGERLATIVKFTRSKTDVDMEIEANEDLEDTIRWFQEWKKEREIVSPYLVVYDRGSNRKRIGQPMSTEYLSRRFSEAVVKAGFPAGKYTLRDVRPKGLTDEFTVAGDSDKGGHKTEQMKKHYRRIRLPMRAKNNLRRLGG